MLKWYGEELKAKKDRAGKWAVDKVLSKCVGEAKRNHDFRNRTSTLEGSIQMRPAEKVDDEVVGQWGSFNLDYAAAIETGAKAHAIPDAFGKGVTVQHPGIKARRFLRNAADKNYPRLKKYIKEAMKK